MFDFIDRYPRLAETEVDGLLGEAGIVFLPGEPFFLRGGEYLPIVQDAGRAIVVIGGNSKNPIGHGINNVDEVLEAGNAGRYAAR